MKQQEIQFFWPLTEQMPLELDYTQCKAHEYYVRAKGIAGLHGPYPTGMQFVTAATTGDIIITAGQLQIDTETTKIITKEKPPPYRRLLYKLLGVKWQLK